MKENFVIDYDNRGGEKKNTYTHDFVNHNVFTEFSIPHEWMALLCFKDELLNNEYLGNAFCLYTMKYYPNFEIYPSLFDGNIMPLYIMDKYNFQFEEYYNHDSELDISEAMQYGDITMEFLIRYCNYSLIKCCNSNVIITAQENCYKKYENLLLQGYSLQRMKKLYYPKVNSNADISERVYKLSILPIGNYPIDEIIEVADGNYQKVLR